VSLKSAVKALLPRGIHYRQVLFGPAAGAVMPIDFARETRMYLGIFERELQASYRRLLRPGMRAFDIGGADGYCALLINRLTAAEVVCFECDATAIPPLRDTFSRNSPRLSAVHALVGSHGLALDVAARQYFFPDFIKIDVEGAEAGVLSTGMETLSRRPSLLVEVHGEQAETDCREILLSHDYKISVIEPTRFFPEQRVLAHNRWLVCERR
jgi:methyltransferase FkbM-like protein